MNNYYYIHLAVTIILQNYNIIGNYIDIYHLN